MKFLVRKYPRKDGYAMDKSSGEYYRMWQAMARFLFGMRTRREKRGSTVNDDGPSPGTTALMSDEDYSQSVFLAESDDETTFAVVPDPSTEIYYARPTFVGDAKSEHASTCSKGRDIKLLLRWRERISQLWKRLLIGQKDDFLLGLDSNQDSTNGNDMDGWSEHFSISTSHNREAPTFQSIYEPPSFDYTPISAFDTVESETRDDDDDDDKSSLSLRKFFENHESSYYQGMFASFTPFGDLSTHDCASVGSALIGVSYDDDCAQLILKDSSSSSESEGDVFLNEEPLGARYPHPAGNSVLSGSTLSKFKKELCDSAWLNKKVDNLWKKLDAETVDDTWDGHSESISPSR